MRRAGKRMELVRVADRKKRRSAERPADEIYLSRRSFVFKGLFLAGFGALIAKLGKMQMVDAQLYQGQAKENILRDEPIRAARGLIVDRNDQVLAENRISWTVSVVPAQIPDDEVKAGYVREQLITALGLQEQLVVRRNGLPLGSEDFILESLAREIGDDPDQLIVRIRRQAVDNLVIVRQDLRPQDIERFRVLERQLPGVHVMNWIDYLLELHAGEPLPITVSEDVDREVALSLEANHHLLAGVVVSDDALLRNYPAGSDFSHILGYVGPITEEEYEKAGENLAQNPYLSTDVVGRGGIEQAMEQALHGRRGTRWIWTDARGVEIAEIEGQRLESQAGQTVRLTIERDFQRAVTQALQDGIHTANEDALKNGKEQVGAGVAIAIDPQTGEIRSLVSLPTYNNQDFVGGISQEQYQRYLDDPFKPLTNLAVSGAYPPGSTIKPLFACAGLQERTLTPGTQYRCLGRIRVPTIDDEQGGNFYVCWHTSGHGQIDLYRAISESCDIYFYNVGAPNQTPVGATEPIHYFDPGDPEPHYFEGLGIERMEQYLKKDFGFGAPTGIELAAEATGLVPNPKWLFQSPLREYWSVGDTINVSIGQGHLSCTPLQLVCAIAAIANGGTYYRPRLVKSLLDSSGAVARELSPEPLWTLSIERDLIEVVRQGMRMTVTDGTAKGKFVKTRPEITIAGKTGTAEFGEAVDGKYKKQHAWFAAFAPYERPEIAVVVLLQGGGEGSTFAVPVADAILAAYFDRQRTV